MFYESLVGQCEYTTQTKGSFWCHVIDAKGAVLLLMFVNKFVSVLYLSFSYRYLVNRLIWYGKLSCIEFCSYYLQPLLSIDLFSCWTNGRGPEGSCK